MPILLLFEFIERLMHYGLTPWIYQFGKSEDVSILSPLFLLNMKN